MEPQNTESYKVLLAGASGLVGQHLLENLIADKSVREIHLLTRKLISTQSNKVHVHVVDFTALPAFPSLDMAYLSIGTTVKVAGSKANFRKIDFETNLTIAEHAVAAGAKKIALVSAAGADSSSNNFYLKTKGELEDALAKLELETLLIARPSLLLGDRSNLGQPARFGEKLAIMIGVLLNPLIPQAYKAVPARAVAKALTENLAKVRGKRMLTSAEIQTYKY